jgi:hypothetical protein
MGLQFLLGPRRIMALGNGPTFGRRAGTSSYRRSFLVAYATRIGSRLRGANAAATVATDNALGNHGQPVLAHRDEKLDAAVGLSSESDPDGGCRPG